MRILENLEPSKVFYYFEEISQIPHTSHNEKAISDYCVSFAEKRNLDYEQDNMGNILIFAPATEGYENADTIIIQGHLDMVGAKTADCSLDLEKDGLELYVDGDFIHAKGTTLGGDDGIAVAYALAILDSDDIPHPDLEILLTVCEEVGLLGATAMDVSSCKGRKLINLDSENEGIFTVGCAGGRRALCDIPLQSSMKNGVYVTAKISGLAGGHSGGDIQKGRGNAILLMGRFLLMLHEKFTYGLIDLAGGEKENVIPSECHANFIVHSRNLEALEMVATEFKEAMKAEYGTSDPNITFTLDYDEEEEETELVLTNFSVEKVLTALNLMPNGVHAMSADLPGLVETSCSMGVAKIENENFHFRISVRSSLSSGKKMLTSRIKHLVTMLDGNITFQGDYPAWQFEKNSPFRESCISVYKEMFGKEPTIEIVHGGLECGILSSKIPGLDCISFGPDIFDVHSVHERMSISSVGRMWEYLKAVLAVK